MLAPMSTSTESIRWDLLESVERAYYTGATAGQPSLPQVSAFVDALPRNDWRLIRLAIIGTSTSLRDFIAASPPVAAAAETFKPSTWLDSYVGWAA